MGTIHLHLRIYLERMNLLQFIIEMSNWWLLRCFKVKNGMCPEIMKDLFQLRQISDGTSKFVIPAVNSEFMGKLSLRYFGPVVWETMLPNKFKEINVLGKFKEEIKKWVPDCKCRLCRIYTAGLGFVETS